MTDSQLSESEFQLYSDFIYQLTGIHLGSNKKQLLVTRLRKRMTAVGISSFRKYREFVISDEGRGELQKMIDEVSTNKTSFFRESAHFQFLEQKVLPGLKTQFKVRIWSAACSSGQEPYTLAMVLREYYGNENKDIKILATDISQRMLDKAQKGIYSDVGHGIPKPLLNRYFLKGHDHWQGMIMAKESLKNIIRFRYLNLMGAFPFSGKFDVIFCRNVMIYFDKPTQANLVERLSEYLNPGGYLFVGHSESLSGIVKSNLSYIQPSVYRKK